METVRMTVHEALCEIKVADKRIFDAIQSVPICTHNKASNTKINGADIKDYIDQSRSSYQKIMDLIRRVNAIKAALSLSNAQTKISVDGKEMTVAEGIYMMQYGIENKCRLLSRMEIQYSDAQKNLEIKNRELQERLDKFIASTFGNKEKANPEDIKVASEVFIKQNTYELVDPLDVKKKIDELRTEIDSFKAHIDSALQISNATTFIEFSY